MVRAVVIGGSIGGLSAAHALLKAGVEVTVVEKAESVSAAGAGLGLDESAREAMASFGFAQEFLSVVQSLDLEVNLGVRRDRSTVVAAKNRNMSVHSTHWSDIHNMLKQGLPKGIMLSGHKALTATSKMDKAEVQIQTSRGQQTEILSADFVVAADGSMSEIRSRFLPNEKRRYSGYCAWRGVLREKEDRRVYADVKNSFPDIGNCLYFLMTKDSGHAVVYELPDKRLNWLWYVTQQELDLKGSSLTQKADESKILEMQNTARQIFPPALASLMKATAAPFINAIYDREPLEQFVWGRIALLGEAAHPTTPHGLRSTNMAIGDATALGKAINSHPVDIERALDAYQKERVPITRQEVLFSRWLGRLKQNIEDSELDWTQLPIELTRKLLQRNVHSF